MVSAKEIKDEKKKIRDLEKDVIKKLKFVVKHVYLDRYKANNEFVLDKLKVLSGWLVNTLYTLESEIEEYEELYGGIMLEPDEATPENVQKAVKKLKDEVKKKNKERATRKAKKGY